MPIMMYDKKTDCNVKVYGFVQTDAGLYGGRGHTYAVTYQPSDTKLWEKWTAERANMPFEFTADDLELKLVPAADLRPLDL